MTPEQGELLVYQAEDGQAAVDVRLKDETVWLTLNQLAELFGRDKSVISCHIRNIFQSGELEREAAVAKNATTQKIRKYNGLLVRLVINLITETSEAAQRPPYHRS